MVDLNVCDEQAMYALETFSMVLTPCPYDPINDEQAMYALETFSQLTTNDGWCVRSSY